MAERITEPWELPFPQATGKASLGYKDIQELAEHLNTQFNSHFLVYKSYAAGATLKAGELAYNTKSGETFKLPTGFSSIEEGALIGVFSNVAETKVTGGFVSSIVLYLYQHAVFQALNKSWVLVSGGGTPQSVINNSENLYSSFVLRKEQIDYTPSNTVGASVILQIGPIGETHEGIYVETYATSGTGALMTEVVGKYFEFELAPKGAWAWAGKGITVPEVYSSYRLMYEQTEALL